MSEFFLNDPLNRQAVINAFVLLLKLIGAAAVVSLVLGTLLATMRVSPIPVLRAVGTAWVGIFRNTPLTLVIFFAYFGLFVNLGVVFSDDLNNQNFWLGVVGLSAYTGAFVCEAIRSGINTIPVGQADGPGRLGLAGGHRVDAAAHRFADEGGGVDDQPGHGEAVVALVHADLRQPEGDEEEHHRQGAVADEGDVGGARRPQRRDRRHPEGGQQRSDQHRSGPGPQTDAERLEESVPVEIEVVDDDVHEERR